MRFAKYIGTGGYNLFGHSDPTNRLRLGHVYAVEHVEVHDSFTNYFLSGIQGVYNSVWFEDIPSYLGFVVEVPKLGKMLDVVREDLYNGYEVHFAHYHTTPVQFVNEVTLNTYLCVTYNTVYIVQVLTR